ncbi:amino acid ABC transporter permease [Kyrpidia tusciae]|uniref:Polar amino acid ABC transporter, inner membrane subunit n=1 Tax=Kyrpidia tusciae (strain DSM 2912 / NBRC 15312 / T2) TaxID=562970 RepID=D5WVJ0_KYRT2|nr:amino acid ABC transporter permease [Kyrpidia tusciae]ADG07533.1 polar amino acid ABC transporter, inner membrane subunit [Kyrpidia tusciae DSM 2912]
MKSLDFYTAFVQLTPSLLEALWLIIVLSVCAFALAFGVGMLIALGRIFGKRPIQTVLTAFLELIRGTPLLVQLLYVYYVIPEIFTRVIDLWIPDYHMNLSAFAASVIGLGINYGCYLSEVFRSSLLAIDKGQIEACLALGYTHRQAMFHIVIPQSFLISLPPLGNYFNAMLKDTSLCAFITLGEIILKTQAYASQTFLTIESYTIAAGIYLIVSIPLGQAVRLLERRLRKHV